MIITTIFFSQFQVLVRCFEPTSLTCLIEPWLRELGFSVFYGSILIKLYRILTEFQTRKAHRVCFRDKDQIVYLLAIVLIVVGYMSAWTALMVDGFFFGQKQQQQQHLQEPLAAAAPNSFDNSPSAEQLEANQNLQERYSLLYSALRNNDDEENNNNNNNLALLTDNNNQQRTYLFGKNFFIDSSSEGNDLRNFRPELNNSLETRAAEKMSSPNFFESFGQSSSELKVKREAPPQSIRSTNNSSSYEIITRSASFLDAGLAVEQLPEKLRTLVKSLNSFSDLFSGLLETSEEYHELNDSLTYSLRCRKLTWDYVTELSK